MRSPRPTRRPSPDVPGLRTVADPEWGQGNYQSFWVEVGPEYPLDREALLEALAVGWCLGASRDHGLAPAAGLRRPSGHVTLPVTEHLTSETLILPLHHQLEADEQTRVTDLVRPCREGPGVSRPLVLVAAGGLAPRSSRPRAPARQGSCSVCWTTTRPASATTSAGCPCSVASTGWSSCGSRRPTCGRGLRGPRRGPRADRRSPGRAAGRPTALRERRAPLRRGPRLRRDRHREHPARRGRPHRPGERRAARRRDAGCRPHARRRGGRLRDDLRAAWRWGAASRSGAAPTSAWPPRSATGCAVGARVDPRDGVGPPAPTSRPADLGRRPRPTGGAAVASKRRTPAKRRRRSGPTWRGRMHA